MEPLRIDEIHRLRPRGPPLTRKCVIRFSNCASPAGLSSCCQIRRTRQPLLRRVLSTKRSRALFRSSLRSQNTLFEEGLFPWTGQLCQKQPSTNKAIRCRGNTKSGAPNTFARRRHPVIECLRKCRIKAISVRSFSRLRTRDIICDRFPFENTSAIHLFKFTRNIVVGPTPVVKRSTLNFAGLTYHTCASFHRDAKIAAVTALIFEPVRPSSML